VNDIEALLDKLVLGFGSVFQDTIVWAAGIDVESAPTPWFQRVDEYGERAWRLVGASLAVVCWDCGNGRMDILTLEPLRTADPAEFRAAAVQFYSRLGEAMQNPDLNGS
jgi:hypothetical protein